MGSFYLENEQGMAVTVNGDRYRVMLNKFLFIKIEEEDIQEENATCHTAEATLDVLRLVFEARIASSRADVGWPPQRCHLTRWTIICRVPSKISATPTSQRQLTL